MTSIELDNNIKQIEARIEQMKNHELFNEREQKENLEKLKSELERLMLLKAKDIEVNNPEVVS